ncbi:glutathione S-transferase family protein [Photobacterium leiognathi]|uniref:glutathione S-transferase family protein n=1 Tax=Photobacterium leiognathi TaxID=553611 RepID=UPI0029828FB9|nr:glutathione S-transferase family protein [Photobacterium leiognathi]
MDIQTQLKLYYYPNNASLAPHFLLHHVNANYELVLVDKKSDAQKSQSYLALNPAGRIPTLVVGEQAIFESAAICIHICELFPQYQLMPTLGDSNRPLFFQWLMFLTNTLQAQLMVRYYPHRNTEQQSDIFSIVSAQEQRIIETLAIINGQLAKNRYLLGDKLSACDYFLFMLAEWSFPLPSSTSFPYLSQYLERLLCEPTIQAVCEIEGIDIALVEAKFHGI